jgi:hypothetical protein
MGRCTWRNDANAYAASSGVRFQRQQMHQKLGCAPGLAGEEGGLTDASRCGFWGFGGLLSGLKRPETPLAEHGAVDWHAFCIHVGSR